MALTSVSRLQAFFIHLAISFVIFLIVGFFITQFWYPDILFELAGGLQAIALIAGVDLVLGPLLTLIVFNPTKKQARELKMDLGVIGLVQAIALAGGVWSVYVNHPVAFTFDGFRFVPILAQDVSVASYKQKVRETEGYLFYAPGTLHSEFVPVHFIDAYDADNAENTVKLLSYTHQVQEDDAGQYIVVETGLPDINIRLNAKTGVYEGLVIVEPREAADDKLESK